jgi:hypothetical protein
VVRPLKVLELDLGLGQDGRDKSCKQETDRRDVSGDDQRAMPLRELRGIDRELVELALAPAPGRPSEGC